MKQGYLLFILLLGLMGLCACQEKTAPRGVVVLVNGEAINLRTVQALMDTRQASLNSSPRPSVNEMRDNYAHAASTLITSALVRQELAARGMSLSGQDIECALQEIKDELGKENFDIYLADAALSEDEWRLLMRDTLALNQFIKKVIMPQIHVSLEEIREYYNRHISDFSKPLLYMVCYGAEEDKESLAAWCKRGEEKGFRDKQEFRCFTVTLDEIPLPWRSEVKKQKLGSCGKLIEQDGQWRSIALISKQEPENLKISTVYPIIENIIYEEKKNEAFYAWLEKKLAAAKITAAPNLFPKSDF